MKNIKYMKGQAAVEYLATYGFAIVVIVIVLAILMSIFGSYAAIEECKGEAGFTCGEIKPVIAADPNNQNVVSITIRLVNGNQQTVHLQEAVCVRGNPTQPPSNVNWKSVDKQVTPGDYIDMVDVPCYEASGDTANVNVGSSFMGKVFVKYRYTSDFPDVNRIAVIKVSQRVSSK